MKANDTKLYRFELFCGRSGTLRGTFVADDIADVLPAIGKRAHFGEVLGKHSEVIVDALEPEHFVALTDDAAFIAKFQHYGCASGFNPLDYITCDNCGDVLKTPYTSCECGWKADA